MNKEAGKSVKMKITLTINVDMPKCSAIPPQTPCNDRSLDDLLSLFSFN